MSEKKKEKGSQGQTGPEKATENMPVEKPLDKKFADQIGPTIGPLLDTHKIENVIVIAEVPGNKDDVAIFYRGHFYDVTKLVSDVYGRFKEVIAKELV
jgi:hypothetical protein